MLNQISTYLGLLVTILSSIDASVRKCDDGEYFSRSTRTCVQCSECPLDQIIRRTCSSYKDIECGPFVEFDPLHFGVKNNKVKQVVSIANEGSFDSSKIDNSYSKNSETDVSTGDNPIEYQSNTHGDQWRTLALSLIGVLSVVCLFLVIFIVVACQLRRRGSRDKQILCDPELRPTYKKKRSPRDHKNHSRQHTASASMECARNSGSERFRVPAMVRPESTSSDVEPSSQQPGTSTHPPPTDYVYFRAPNNGNDVP